jgi:hypothetical protein
VPSANAVTARIKSCALATPDPAQTLTELIYTLSTCPVEGSGIESTDLVLRVEFRGDEIVSQQVLSRRDNLRLVSARTLALVRHHGRPIQIRDASRICGRAPRRSRTRLNRCQRIRAPDDPSPSPELARSPGGAR